MKKIYIYPAMTLYSFAVIDTVVTLFVLGPLLNIAFSSWAEYYRAMGELLRIWGYLFGIVFAICLYYILIKRIYIFNMKNLLLRMSFLDKIMLLLFFANIIWALIGIILNYPPSYVLGDTFKGMFIPVIYWVVKEEGSDFQYVLSFVKLVFFCESLLLFILVPTGYVPISFAGRTFMTTVFFTLFFEEKKSTYRIFYAIFVLFGLFTILTTAAVRGSILTFFIIIILNYVYRLRKIPIGKFIIGFVIPFLFLFFANEFFELKLEKQIDVAGGRFKEAVSGGKKYFGFDESIFQRIGETVDVGRTFSEHNPLFLISGFGNGAILDNKLITPSEHWIYKTNKKHNLYITAVAVLFRNGIVGLLLYSSIIFYIFKVLRLLKKTRETIPNLKDFVYLKILCFLQFAAILNSFVAYWYIGNIVIAFTLPLIEMFRIHLMSRVQNEPVPV